MIYIPEESDTTGFKHYGNENSGRHKRGSGKDPFQALKRAHIIPWGENFRQKAEDVKNAVGQRVEKHKAEKVAREKERDHIITNLYRASDEDRERMVKNVRLGQLAAVLVTGNDSINKGKLSYGPLMKSGIEQKGMLINYINHPDQDPVNQRAMKVNEASRNGEHYKMTPKEIKEDREFAKLMQNVNAAQKTFYDIDRDKGDSLVKNSNYTRDAAMIVADRISKASKKVAEVKDNSEKLDRIPKPTLLDKAKEALSNNRQNSTSKASAEDVKTMHDKVQADKSKLSDVDPRDLKVIHPANTVRGKIQRIFDKDVKEALSDKPANRQNSTSKTKSEDIKVTYDKMQQTYEKQKAAFKYADEMRPKIDKDYEKVRSTLSNNPNVNMMYPVAVDQAKDSKPIIYLDSDYLTSNADYNAAAKEWEKLGYYVEKL